MAITSLHRRAVLQTGAVAAGSLALGSMLQPAAAGDASAEAGPALVSGTLAGWIVVDLHREAVIRFAHVTREAPPLELGEPARVSLQRWSGLSCLDQMGVATTAAHRLAQARLARAWGVARRDCMFERGRIRDRRSARAIGYSVWVDLV